MKKRILAPICFALVGLFVLAGCSGGGGTAAVTPPTGASLSGRAMVPAGTPTRSVSTDIPLPFATATLTDITAGLPGTTFATTQTGGQGDYQFTNLVFGHNYTLKITKTVTGPNGPMTINLGAYIHVGGGGVTASSLIPMSQWATLSSTVALNYILGEIASGHFNPDADLYSIMLAFAEEFDAQREAGTAPDIDLTKDCYNPNSFSNETHNIVGNSLKTGAYFDSKHSSSNTLVNLLFKKDTHQVAVVLCLLDAAGDFFDTDYFMGETNGQGGFSGTTKDGLYTIKGQFVANGAAGTWAAKDGTGKGVWSVDRQTNGSAYKAKGYAGSFTKTGRQGEEGTWFFFVDKNGKALMLAHDEAFEQRSHLLKTALLQGTVSASGQVTGGMVFPAIAGSVTGGDPAAGGTVTGTGDGSAGGHTGNGTGSVTGAINGDSVSGTWSFSGLRDGSAFNASGTWGGIQL